MSKHQLLRIEDLVLSNRLYPRARVNIVTAYAYAQAMEGGSVFPPIIVGFYKKKHYVLDGWHRIEALKHLKEEYVKAEVNAFKTYREMFAEAVRRNSTHGRSFSIFEKMHNVGKLLKHFKFSREEISEIVKVSVDYVKRFEVSSYRTEQWIPDLYEDRGEPKPKSWSRRYLKDAPLEPLIFELVQRIKNFEDKVIDRAKELSIHLYWLLNERLFDELYPTDYIQEEGV